MDYCPECQEEMPLDGFECYTCGWFEQDNDEEE